MTQLFPLAAITDEFSQDLETAIRTMAELGMTGAELRMLLGKNIVDLNDAEVAQASEIVSRHGLEIVSIASPLLKCILPNSSPMSSRTCSPPRTPSKTSHAWRTARSKSRSAPAPASFASSRTGARCD